MEVMTMEPATKSTVKPARRRKAKMYDFGNQSRAFVVGRKSAAQRARVLLDRHGHTMPDQDRGFLKGVITQDQPYPQCMRYLLEIERQFMASAERTGPVVVARNDIAKPAPAVPTKPQSVAEPVRPAPWRDPGMCYHRGCRCQLVPHKLPDNAVNILEVKWQRENGIGPGPRAA
jgi:hypothetical protein